MFGRKKRLLEASQQYYQASQEISDEAKRKLAHGVVEIGKTVVTGDFIYDAVHGVQGVSKLVEGGQMLNQASQYHEAAKTLEEEAQKSKWWHL
jgi:hypothetical protein